MAAAAERAAVKATSCVSESVFMFFLGGEVVPALVRPGLGA